MAVSRRFRSVAFGLLLVATVPGMVPGVSGATTQNSGFLGGPCVTTSDEAPGVTVDPRCRPSSTSAGTNGTTADNSPLNTTAVSSGLSVVVNWTLPEDYTGIVEFQVERGATPWTLDVIWEGGLQNRSYTDTTGWSSGESVWYQVHAVDAHGQTVVESEPVMVTVTK